MLGIPMAILTFVLQYVKYIFDTNIHIPQPFGSRVCGVLFHWYSLTLICVNRTLNNSLWFKQNRVIIIHISGELTKL